MKLITTLTLFCTLLTPLPSPAQDKADTAPAIAAAQAWLAEVDAANYAHSWELAASEFQAAIARPDWVASLQTVRSPLGAARQRQLLSAQYTLSLPDAPAGEYVVIRFKTEFANKAASLETITPKKDSNGQWRVSGYFIY